METKRVRTMVTIPGRPDGKISRSFLAERFTVQTPRFMLPRNKMLYLN